MGCSQDAIRLDVVQKIVSNCVTYAEIIKALCDTKDKDALQS